MGGANTKNYQKQGGADWRIGGTITEELGGDILSKVVLNTSSADIGTAGSTFIVSPFAGTIVNLSAVNTAANAGTKTVLLAKLAGTTVTAPAWEVGVTAAAGTATSVVPTAANTVTAGQVIELNFDGGSSSVTPAVFSVVIARTA